MERVTAQELLSSDTGSCFVHEQKIHKRMQTFSKNYENCIGDGNRRTFYLRKNIRARIAIVLLKRNKLIIICLIIFQDGRKWTFEVK